MLSQLEEKQVTYLKVLVTSLYGGRIKSGIPLGLYLGLTLWQSFMASGGNIMIIYPGYGCWSV